MRYWSMIRHIHVVVTTISRKYIIVESTQQRKNLVYCNYQAKMILGLSLSMQFTAKQNIRIDSVLFYVKGMCVIYNAFEL